MKQKLALLLVVMLLLSACGTAAQVTEPPVQTQPPTQAPTEAPTDAPTEPPTEAPTEPPAPYTNPLTGEGIDYEYVNRPFTVILNNYEAAMPLHGISEADIVYEGLTEGGMTRCMGVYSNLSAVENLGSIRSARRHFVSISVAYDAIFVHYGKSEYPGLGAQDYMNELGWNHMDGTAHGYPYFYENMDRYNNGWPTDACHFLVGQRALDYAMDNRFALTRDEPMDYGLHFEKDHLIIGKPANKLSIYFNQGGTPGTWTKSTIMQYDASSGEYLSFQYGKENVDGNTGKQLSFENVLVLRAKTQNYADVELIYVELEGEGTGYYACNGQLVPIKWSRASAYDPFVYTLEDGTPLTLSVGKSYVAIVPTNATVNWE